MIPPEWIETAAIPLSTFINQLENWTLQTAAARIVKMGRISGTTDYQLSRLEEIMGFEADYKKQLAELTKLSQEEIARLYWEVAEISHEYDKKLFDALDKPFVPVRQNAFMQQIVPAMIAQTQGTMANITRTTALKFLSPYKKFVPLPEAFRQHLDFAEFKVSTGVQDYNSAIKEAVRTLSDAGMRVIRYEGEDKRPVNRRVESVARVTVLTGMAQLAGQVSAQNIVELDMRHVWVSAHTGARTGKGGGFGDITNHLFWQGKIYSLSPKFFRDIAGVEKNFIPDSRYADLLVATGLSDVAGLHGAHCRHSYSGILPDIQEPPLSEQQLKELQEQAERKTKYTWTDSRGVEHSRTFSLREALDRQNELALRLRELRRRAVAFKQAGLDEDYTATKVKYRKATAEYKHFSDAMGIDYNFALKVYHDGLGRI